MVRAISSLQVALECDDLDAVGDYETTSVLPECLSRMLSVVVKIKTLKRDSRLIEHKLETGWFVGVDTA